MMSSGACSSGGMGGGSPPKYSGKVPRGQPSSKGKQLAKRTRPPQGFLEEIVAVIRFRLQEEACFNEENMRWLLEPLEELIVPEVREEINFDHEVVQRFCHEGLEILEANFPMHAVCTRMMASRNICDARNMDEKRAILGDYLRKMRAGYRPEQNNLQRLLCLVSMMAIDIFHAMQRSAIVDLARAAVNFVIQEWRVGESASAADDWDYTRRLVGYACYNELRYSQQSFHLEGISSSSPSTTPPIVVPSGLQAVTTQLYIPEPEYYQWRTRRDMERINAARRAWSQNATLQAPINLGTGQASNDNPQPTLYFTPNMIIPTPIQPLNLADPFSGPFPGTQPAPSSPPSSDDDNCLVM